jgi:DNA-binding winged helix-turn-helix (wHTH) protein/TolB-like protein/Tfp pilus assembly protein PilF
MSTSSQLRQAAGKSELPLSYEFGPFVLDTMQHALLKHSAPVDITPKTYDTLLVLLQNNGRMLSKEELMQAVWPDSFVEESNLTQQVSMIRKALGESATEQRYVITVPGRGYRFTGDVRTTDLQASAGTSSQPIEQTPPGETNAPADVSLLPLTGKRTSKRTSLLFMTAFSVLAVALVAITNFVYRAHVRPQPPVGPRSLAILPLQNRGQDSSSDFLGLSLADVLITKLAYVNSLSVRPSAAIEKYRGATIDLQKVAADLKVETLLTGSFIRDGDNLRITYQLVDAKTEKILGQGLIDLKYDNLLAVQDRVTGQLISELELRLSPSEAERLKPGNPVSPLAYEYFLQGLDFHGQHKFPLAIKMLEKSTQIDPNYAPAWAYLGASYNSDAAFELGGREQYRRAQAAYERALAIRPNLLDAQVFLANLLIDTGKVEQAVPLLRDALKTNGNYAAAHWELGYAYRFAGMLDESVAECERARQLAPLVKGNGSVLNTYLYLGQYQKFLESLPLDDSSFILFYRAFGEFHEQHFEQASRDFDRAYELDPSLYAGIGKALSYSIHQRQGEGLDLSKGLEGQIRARGVGDPEGTYKLAQAYAVLGDKPSAMRVLRMSVESGFFSYPYIVTDPLLNDLHGEPGFDEAVKVAHQRYEAFKRSFFK